MKVVETKLASWILSVYEVVADASAVALCKGEGRCGEAGMQLGAGGK
jgi:hypothetical protein